jgi:hypothetical protein
VNQYWHPDWKLYRRAFAHGIVLVNPAGAPVTIAPLGAVYRLVMATGGGAVPPPGAAVLASASDVRVPASQR